MKKQEDKFTKRRLRTSYITSVISITLVLFLLGFFGLIVLHAKKISTHVKENIQVTVFMKRDANEADILRMKKTLDASDGIKSTKYISSTEAAETFEKEIGEDFLEFLDGDNPIHASIQVFLNEDYANVDSLTSISKRISAEESVEEIQFHKDYVQTINDNIAKLSIFFLVFSSLLLLIAIILINNTIRLSIFAHRFIIRTMNLIGATQSFIRKPFIFRGVIQGIISALISIGLLIAVLLKLSVYAPDLINLENLDLYLILFACVLLLGIIISWWSTFFAVRKYLRMKLDNLYLH